MWRGMKNVWWLRLGAAFELILAVLFFNAAEIHSRQLVVVLGWLTMAAGVCTLATAIWSTAIRQRWLLLLNGVAGCGLGLILSFATRVSFRTIALMVTVMAVSLGAQMLMSITKASWSRNREWLSAGAGSAAIAFGLVFLAFVFHWIRLDPTSPAESFLWLGSFFGWSAVCSLDVSLAKD